MAARSTAAPTCQGQDVPPLPRGAARGRSAAKSLRLPLAQSTRAPVDPLPRIVAAFPECSSPWTLETPPKAPTARYVLLPLANLLTGYSVKAMQRKIERGDWQEGKVWRRAPDGRIVIDVLGYQRWIEGPARGA